MAFFACRKEKLEAVGGELRQKGVRALAIQCDVTSEESVKAAVEEVIREFGRIDILFNNAGVAVRGRVDNMTVEEWDKSFDTNVKGMFLVSKYVVPHMQAQRYGKIVNLASVNAVPASKVPNLSRHSYNASKAAVRGLTMGMAAAYMQDGITVNSVGPGLFETEMTANTPFANERFLQGYSMANPASRPARKGELNGTILYFSSDASSYVTSQHIIVDGGLSVV